MTHTILNQHNQHIQGKKNIKEIRFMLREGMDRIEIDDREITVISDFRKGDERVTVVNVEGI